MVIEGDTITCVAAVCPDPPGATVFTVSDAFAFFVFNLPPEWHATLPR